MKVDLKSIGAQNFEGEFVITSDTPGRFSEFFQTDAAGIFCQFQIRDLSKRYNFRGTVKGNLFKPCDYCLEDAKYEIDGVFEYFLMIRDSSHSLPLEKEISPEDTNTDFIEDYELDSQIYFEDYLFLEAPSVFLCNPDCKGLCSSCGKNLNHSICDCDQKQIEKNPFYVLKKLNI